MMTMTYNSLAGTQDPITLVITAGQIANYLNRPQDQDLFNQIPNFIYQAEQKISRESKSIGLEIYVTGSFTVGSAVLTKPARWRRNLTFNYGTGINNNTRNQLFLRSYEFLRNYWPDDTQTAPPLYYSDYAYDHLLVAPTPDQAYPFEFSFLQLPDPLSTEVQINWLTNNAPDVLLYACLLEAIPYLKNDERVPLWQATYDRGLASLTQQDNQRLLDRASNIEAD